MSAKRKPTPPPTKRPTSKISPKKATPEKAPKALTERIIEPPQPMRETAMKLAEGTGASQVFVPGEGWLELPKPALLSERQEADELMNKLTNTLPKHLETEINMGQASEHLIICRKLRKLFEDKHTELKKPINAELEKLKNEYNPYVVRLKAAEENINLLLRTYRDEATKRQQLEDQRRADEHKNTMNDARAQGVNPLSVPAPLPAAAPPSGFQTAHGKTGTMRVGKWRVVDNTQVPFEYNGTPLWLLNEAGIGQVRRSMGVEAVSPIPGIEFYIDETTVVR